MNYEILEGTVHSGLQTVEVILTNALEENDELSDDIQKQIAKKYFTEIEDFAEDLICDVVEDHGGEVR